MIAFCSSVFCCEGATAIGELSRSARRERSQQGRLQSCRRHTVGAASARDRRLARPGDQARASAPRHTARRAARPPGRTGAPAGIPPDRGHELRPRRRRRPPPPSALALVELARDGARREWTLRRGRRRAPRGWPARSPRAASGRGDVVMTLIGNRPEWVLAMVACFRIGAVVLPCTEQLRAKDLRAAARRRARRALVARRRAQPRRAARRRGRACPVLAVPDERALRRPSRPPARRARARATRA